MLWLVRTISAEEDWYPWRYKTGVLPWRGILRLIFQKEVTFLLKHVTCELPIYNHHPWWHGVSLLGNQHSLSNPQLFPACCVQALTKEWNWTSWIVKLLLLHFIINTKGFHKKFCISWKAKIYWKLKSYLFIRETILCRQRLEQTFGAVLNIKQNNTYCGDNIKETEELKSRENEHRGVTLFWLAAIITGLGVILFR